MEEPLVLDPHMPPLTYSAIHQGDAEPLPIPPLDDDMFNFDSGISFDIDEFFNLDDVECTEDHIPNRVVDDNSGSFDPPSSDNSSLTLILNSDHSSFPDLQTFDHWFSGQGIDVAGVSNSEINLDPCPPRVYDNLTPPHDFSSERSSLGAGPVSDSANWNLNGLIGPNNQSNGPESNPKLNHSSPDSVSCINVSSHLPPGENSCSSGSLESVSETLNTCSEKPDSAGSSLKNGTTEGEFKTENLGRRNASKRKKKEDWNSASRTCKPRKSSVPMETTNAADASETFTVGSEEGEDKKKARLMRNRESAQLSRERKKQYVSELEGKLKYMSSTITDLNRQISFFAAENAALRHQLNGAGVYPPPNPGMFPMPPMGYPWGPYPPYMVNPQGSNVPLVPIPRIKPQRPDPAPKASRKTEKPAGKKSEGKTKKVASVSFLGLLFFFLLFAGLVPMVNVKYGLRIGETSNRSEMLSNTHKGRVLMVENDSRKSGNEGGRAILHKGDRSQEENLPQPKAGDDWSFAGGNSTTPLAASLYVPRNDKLVQIDGNLIIHSVLASERAAVVSSVKEEQVKKGEETSLAIPTNRVPVYHVAGSPRALDYVPGDNLKSSANEGSWQQWFHAGLEGPLLSSGLCTKVFEFDVSPTPGSMFPVTSMTNSAASSDFIKKNATVVNRSKNRKVLRGPVIPVDKCDHKVGEEYNMGPDAQRVGLEGNKSTSSAIVVSVLVDPRDAVYVEGENMIRSQSLSRIFVVLLVDGVKYMTYSCVLPRMGSSPQLVRA